MRLDPDRVNAMASVTFRAFDYRADTTFVAAQYRFAGDEPRGWRIERDGRQLLELGPGFRLLRVRQCGVCSTDLARHHLPFPLPQVIGHEVIAVDERGARFAVEINASHTARGVAHDCAFCRAGLGTHCPDRVTLGIDALPGGFGPWILAPVAACVAIPPQVQDSTAVLVEPFAAALHAVETIAPRPGDRVAVLGPRRLGMLVVAALAGWRRAMRAKGGDFVVGAVVRDPALAKLAATFGASEVSVLHDGAEVPAGAFDVVIDTTGNPAGLATAVRLARREVHLKSTHGQASCGLQHLTGLVVDELGLARFPDSETAAGAAALRRARVAWLAATEPPAWLAACAEVQRGEAAKLAREVWATTKGLPRADLAVASDAAGIDAAIRPVPGVERSLVRPRGRILLCHANAAAAETSPLLAAIRDRGLVLSSSRCGDFRAAIDLLANDPELQRLGERLVTHHFPIADLPRAFAVARGRGCIKAVIEHETRGATSPSE
ncbi:MAG: alcohol dehydrogenase catalytic domain-containing protein [Planctomycetota bacterium]